MGRQWVLLTGLLHLAVADPALKAAATTPLRPWLEIIKLEHLEAEMANIARCTSVESLELHRATLLPKLALPVDTLELLEMALDGRVKVQAVLSTLGDPASAGRVSHKLQQSAMISDSAFAPDVFSLTLFLVGFVLWYVWRVERIVHRGRAIRRTWQQTLIRAYLDPLMSFVDFEEETGVVGRDESFVVWHMQGNGFEHVCSAADAFVVSISGPAVNIRTSVATEESHRVVKYTTRKSGRYHIRVELLGEPVSGSPFTRWFLPDAVDPSKCKITRKVITAVAGTSSCIKVLTRDKYGNPSALHDEASFRLTIRGSSSTDVIPTILEVLEDEGEEGCLIHFQVNDAGAYLCDVAFRLSEQEDFVDLAHDTPVTVLVLTQAEMDETDANIADRQNRYEAIQLSHGQHQGKTVYVYIQPSQMFVRIFFIRVFAWKIHTMRVQPASDFSIYDGKAALDDAARDFAQRNAEGSLIPAPEADSVFMLDDRCQEPIVLSSPKRNVLFATYCRFLSDRVGGNHSFDNKYRFFEDKIKHISVDFELQAPRRMVIKRAAGLNLIRNVQDAFSGFTERDWRRRWNIKFVDEEGIDCGGVTRELFTLLGEALFDPQIGLFCSFGADGEGGLVHPNRILQPGISMATFQFAGKLVGKAMYESAHGRKVNLPARFTRSFLASLLGLRSNYSFFESDDPEYYKRKIRYILEHSVEGLDLFFCEEEYDRQGNVLPPVDLKPHGQLLPVTNANKLEYLNLLALHRLETSVREQVKHFLQGLNEVVPDTLISMFDENELELLICGHSDYSIYDMREASELTGMNRSYPAFLESVEWFWITVENFTPDERRRLLQFVTGSGVLPLGGFASLKPKLNISYTGTNNTLPMAHTCFNQFCLPTYDCLEDLHRALVTAITEGGEGFNLE